MTRLEALILCDLIVVAPDRKFQLQGVFDRIFTPHLPAKHTRAFLYFRLYVEGAAPESKQELRLNVSGPGGHTEQLAPTQVTVGPRGKVEGYIQLLGLPLRQAGNHWLRLFLDDQEVGAYQFEVVVVDTAPTGSGSQMVH